MRNCLILLLTLFCFHVNSQDVTPYQILDSKGKKSSFAKLAKAAEGADIILFGELHNNAISHYLQLELAKYLAENKSLVMGAEMLEADNQDELDQYLKGEIDQKALDTMARLWQNHKTDYAPLVDLAKDEKLRFVATNVPRRYASLVYHNGPSALDTLSDEEKTWIAPLPFAFDSTLSQYAMMMQMMPGHGGMNLAKAQAIKDATMAHFILKNMEEGKTFLHFNGRFHSDFYQGILWYLQQARPDLTYLTITTGEVEDPSTISEDDKGAADFIINVDQDMTKTY